MNKDDLIENIEFHPLEKIVGTKLAITKSFCLESGRKVFDEDKRLIGIKIVLHKSSKLIYEILENESSISLGCALNEEVMECLKDDFDLTDFSTIWEGTLHD